MSKAQCSHSIKVDADGKVALCDENGNTTVEENGISSPIVYDNISLDNYNGQFVLTVQNSPGESLPATGGSGTKLIYILGALMSILASAGLVMCRRRKTE